MMRTHWLLLKASRRELIVFGMPSALVLVAVGYFGHETAWLQLYSLSGPVAVWLSLLFAVVIVRRGFDEHRRICRALPITERTIAWTPPAHVGLLSVAGLACVAAAQAFIHFFSLGTVPWTEFWGAAAMTIPLAVLAVLLLHRGERAGSPIVFLFPMFIIFLWLSHSHSKSDPDPISAAVLESVGRCVDAYPLWWPLTVPLILLYLLEAPYHVASVGREVGLMRTLCLTPPGEPDFPVRHHPVTLIGDFVWNCLAAIWLIPLILVMLPTLKELSRLEPFARLFGILVLAAVVRGSYPPTRKLFRSVEASSFRGSTYCSVLLLAMSGLFAPIAKAMGLKRGETVRCRQCTRHRFVWALRCPHCHVQAADLVYMSTPLRARLSHWHNLTITDVYRFTLPLIIVFNVAILSTTRNGELSEAVTYERVQIVLGAATSPDDRMRAVNAFRDTATRLLARGDWPAREETSGLAAPERHSFAATYEADRLFVECYSLRWAPATGLAEALARQVLNELDADGPLEVDRARGAPLWTPSVWGWGDPFDGRFRWVYHKE